ncbi:MAG TPA: hypothetical protein VFZ52_04015 [Chryseolinea sp.]
MKNYVLVFALFLGVHAIQAQTDTTQKESAPSESAQTEGGEITDDELEKYAVTMDSVNDMKASLLKDIETMVKGNEKMTTARYNDLSKIVDDEAALAKAKATPEEIAFMKEVAAKKEEGTTRIQETFQSMAKDYVGASAYNKIKKGLASDPELQKRYQSHMDKLGASDVN